MIDIELKRSEFYPAQWEFLSSKKAINGFVGGLGSGKTHVFLRKTLLNHLTRTNKDGISNGWIIYPTYELSEELFIQPFIELLQEYKPQGIDRFEFEGETYFFPKEFLKRNTFGDYIESTHLESTIQIMKHGRFDVLPEQMAILCRKTGEEYDDDKIPQKSDKFKELTMDIVWEFSFFLTMQSVKLTRTFQTFLGKTEEEVEEVKTEFLQLDSTTNS